MERTSRYIISLLLILFFSIKQVEAQDTLNIPLKIRVGFEVSGPAQYYSNKNILSMEGYISTDLNEKRSFFIGGGYLNYKYSQNDSVINYNYTNKGFFVRAGYDFNLLKVEKSQGKYWAGIGLHYGLSHFMSDISFQQVNYWGSESASIQNKTSWGHFVEATPGVKAEVFKNFSIGWTISLRLLLHTTTSKELRPLYIPGFGNGAKTVSAGLSYFIVYNIPYKKIRVITKKDAPEEEEDPNQQGTVNQQNGLRQ